MLNVSQASDAPNIPNAFARIRSTPPHFMPQIEAALTANIRAFAAVGELPQIHWGGKQYVLEQHLQRAKSRGRRSWIKDYGFFITEILAGETKGAFWACRACSQRNRP